MNSSSNNNNNNNKGGLMKGDSSEGYHKRGENHD
jgi:hypothetical protein